jgi:hypothetical protein
MITVENLSKTYGDTSVIRDISFQGSARPSHRLPRPQRRRQIDVDADDGRHDFTNVEDGHHQRAPIRRPAEPGARGRRDARCVGPARRSHRPRDPDHRPADDGGTGQSRRRAPRDGQPHCDGGRSARRQLLARHAPAPWNRRRHREDRPGTHRLPGLEDRAPASGWHVVRSPDSARLHRALVAAGIAATESGDGAFRTGAGITEVGRAAHKEGVLLTELRTSDSGGLEDMFLELTADTQRERTAA